MPEPKICIYCTKTYSKDTEHVFPHGLGGQRMFMDCVCEKCNGYFSALERELYQKSFVGLLRSTEGVSGYKTKSNKKSPFKAPILLTLDEVNNIVFEVGQYHRMQTFIRPQIIYVGNDFYLEGDTTEGVEHFVGAVKRWRDENLMIVVGGEIKAVYTHHQTHFEYEFKTEKSCGKGFIHFCCLPETHELYAVMEPRLFIDDDKELKVRAKNLDEAIQFLHNFLNRQLTKKDFSSFSNKALTDSVIYVGFNFNGLKLEQALVKIGLNCLFHYYPNSRYLEGVQNPISYVMTGNPGIMGGLDNKSSIIDNHVRTHNVFFHQLGDALKIRLSMFSGQFIFYFWIKEAQVLKDKEFSRVIVKFDERINNLETQTEFLESFRVDSTKTPIGEPFQ